MENLETEALQSVLEINRQLYECIPQFIEENGPLVEFVSIGEDCAVNFMGISIFDSAVDEREWKDEENGEREPIGPYLKRRVYEVAGELVKIELK